MAPKAIRRVVAWARRRRRRGRDRHGLVLMYHRVAEVAMDPWRLAVQPAHFESQVRVLSEWADIVPLGQLHSRLRAGRRSRPVVAITFDDGYLDNLIAAKPVLERHAAPATVFIPTGYVGAATGFWWDRLAELLLRAETLPTQLELAATAAEFRWSDAALAVPGGRGRSARRRLHDAVWRWLHPLPEAERDQALDRLGAWTGVVPAVEATGRPMSREELHALVAGGLIEVGAHSVTHPLLSRLSSKDKAIEILGSRAQCIELMGRAPAAFAFPNGDLDDECVALVKEAGFDLACTSRQELVWAVDDVHRTPRISVPDASGESLLRRLRLEWLS